MSAYLQPHRIVLIAIGVGIVVWCAVSLNWTWLATPKYLDVLPLAIWRTIWLTVVTMALGMVLAIGLGFAQAAGPAYLAIPARMYCSVIRGTPLLLQLWLLYYGLGSVFAQFPEIRESFLWPILRQAWPYAVLALTLSVAGYEGEVMRGAFKGVPNGQLEAARAMGVPRFTTFRRIWLPQALHRALPTIGGEAVLQMKSTPLVATITVVDIYSLAKRVTQDTFIVYEPLLLLALVYMILAGGIVLFFRWLESRLPVKTA
ncbi:ABC transporter permease subunit [Tabrizicola sp.]|uniref:ABC transporter permease n=1 Tax=Tabrizicola sp. TaxID=2005166 RepID=UPI00286CFAD0|nr:ABC transporter permease subunit [Tabrizicola sp.]